jgi:beta-alanine degradation protein BauB
MSEDAVKIAPNVAKVLFENDRLRVLEIRLKGRQKIAMHSHPANLNYALTSAKMKSTSPDGKSQVLKIKKGKMNWSDGGSHAVENLNSTMSISLTIELKK